MVAPDLPGHGFTDAPAAHRLSLPAMARRLRACWHAGRAPALAVGHSAGAAILARMCLDGRSRRPALVGLNGALLPLAGPAGQLFAPLARLLVGLPLLPQLFAWRAARPARGGAAARRHGLAARCRGVRLYARLVRDPATRRRRCG